MYTSPLQTSVCLHTNICVSIYKHLCVYIQTSVCLYTRLHYNRIYIHLHTRLHLQHLCVYIHVSTRHMCCTRHMCACTRLHDTCNITCTTHCAPTLSSRKSWCVCFHVSVPGVSVSMSPARRLAWYDLLPLSSGFLRMYMSFIVIPSCLYISLIVLYTQLYVHIHAL